MIRKIRLTLAAVMFTIVTLLFLDISGSLHAYLGWAAKIQFWPAFFALNIGVVAVLVVATFVFGRIYCSVICPLGILQDILSRLNRRKNRYSYTTEKRILRYAMLVLFVVCAVAGLSVGVSLLEPYSSFGRIVTSLVQPVYTWGNNLLAVWAGRAESYAFYSREVWLRSVPTLCVAAVTLVLLAVLAWRGGRTCCNTICPVGTLLSLVSRFSLMRMTIDADKCKSCNKCARNCKSQCIDIPHHTIDHSRCVVCGNCEGECRFDALHYRFVGLGKLQNCKTAKVQKCKREEAVDTGRRTFLLGAGLAVAGSAMAKAKGKVDGGLAVIEDRIAPERHTPITPPGSWSARHMQQHCTACQLCVSKCPNDVLRPSSGLMTLMQPTMSYERGYCRVECTACSEVCPTGAIRPISREEKSAIQIGHAVLVRSNCIPLTVGDSCGNCARHCPSGAIIMVDQDDPTLPRIPTVNESKCIGCGACENLCPARPFAAIYVEGFTHHQEI